jgi:glycosyltransferase involved in cell wall biosynthesis
LIAGKPYSAEFKAAVEAQAASIPNLHLHLGYVPDDEIQHYLRAADCFVAPYKYIETCSAIYLALAYDLPIIIKSEGNVVDFETQAIGIFMQDAAQVGAAMQQFLEMPAGARDRMRAATREAARAYSWDRIAAQYRAAFAAFEAAAR